MNWTPYIGTSAKVVTTKSDKSATKLRRLVTMPYKIVSGNLLDVKKGYIVQQCCCTATKAQGLAAAIAAKYPSANPYAERRKFKGTWAVKDDRPTPGTISVVKSDGVDGCCVVNAFAQYCHGTPGKVKDPLEIDVADSASDRLSYFSMCLDAIAKLNPKVVAFPYKIGCGLAGGSWSIYEILIMKWSEKTGIDVTVYKLD